MFVLKQVLSPNKTKLKQLTKFLPTHHVSSSVNNTYIKLDIHGKTLKFPSVWLRDNCQCDQCFHSSAKSRILDWNKFNINVQAKSVTVTKEAVQITWDDGHTSKYTHSWLNLRGFTEEIQKYYKDNIYRPKKIIWNGEDFNQIFSKHDYNNILKSNEALYDWLHALSIYGVALIKNAPNLETAVDRIVDKVGFTKQTHYGIKFIVQNVQNTSNVAYLTSNLPMHTDLPYYEYMPGVNLLHCLVQTSSMGGYNLVSDGHYIANYMKHHHPEQYKLLTEVDVEWSDIGIENGNEFFKLYRSPVINVNHHGEITKICFSIPQRGSQFPGCIDDVKPWYEAHDLFYELNQKFSAKFKTEAGDILVFDNIRLLHGRNAYEDNTGNARKLIGAYLDWDEIYSRLRCLNMQLKQIDGI